ncbi:MAG TPA: SIS domain-containing protein, partial [Patescibacteria group bacterium]|nr:SIS domain-containing protein [Patescibacteria group bacterium]
HTDRTRGYRCGVSLRDEILEQPDAARRQLASSVPAIEGLAGRLRAHPVDAVVIAARGTSDHAAIYAQYLLGAINRLAVGLATPSLVSIYGVEPRFERTLVIGISQSGASPDVVGVVAAARRQGAATLAITNEPASELGTTAEFTVDLAAGAERAVAATKTYTTSLLAIARLALALESPARWDAATGRADDAGPVDLEPKALRSALDELPNAIAQALRVEPEVEALAGELARGEGAIDRCVIVGRGFEYATAREWALKLKELGRVFADPYSAADFLHGPIALVQPGIPVLVLAPAGAAASGVIDLLRDLRDREVDTVVVSDVAETRTLGRWSIELPPGIPEPLRPIVSIVPAQLFAYHLTRARGLDPDEPRYLSKVTRTT